MELSIPHSPRILGPAENPAIARARELVLSYGWNSTAFQIVNPGIRRWFSAEGDAVVGFVPAGGFRVVAGAPVCSAERLPQVASEFEAAARNEGEEVCYFCAESRLESNQAAMKSHAKFLIGAQPSWRPANWKSIVRGHRSLRAQLNRARNKGVTVTEWPESRARSNPSLIKCLHEWLETKGLPPLHFMVEPETLSRLEYRRTFVAEREGEVVGFVVLSPVAQRNGWLFEQFPHVPSAPNGTVELMIDTAMDAIAADGSDYATLGLSPLSRRISVEGLDNPFWLRLLLAWLRKHGKRFYNFDGLDAFKAKLQPETWEPVFAVCSEPRVRPRTIYAIAVAFSGNAPIRMVAGGLWKAAAAEFRHARRSLISIRSNGR